MTRTEFTQAQIDLEDEGGRMKPNQKKTYPSHVLTDGLRAKNIMVHCLWETSGPVNTQIAWLTAYLVCSPGRSAGHRPDLRR